MSQDKNKSSNSSQGIAKDSGRGLPTTNTRTPMPPVEKPKQPNSSGSDNK